MKYKIISMDFDGTLLTSEKKVTKKTKDILIKYKNEGYHIVGITARNFSSVKSVCDTSMFNFIILNNGANIYDVKKDSIVSLGDLNIEIVEKLTNYFSNIASEIDYCGLNHYYSYRENNNPHILKIDNFKQINEPIVRMNIFLEDSNSDYTSYINYIKDNYTDLEAFIMTDTDIKNGKKWIAINQAGIDKFETLKKLCNNLKVNIDQVIFFGDSSNDIKIINNVGMGVAMENALDIVKKKAKTVTLSNDEEGIYYFLKNNI